MLQHERQQQRELDTDLRDELDEGLDDIRALLQESDPGHADPSRRPAPRQEEPDANYDQVVRSLAFDARSKPKNRTKTEDELAVEEKERLESAEVRRLRRMRGEVSDEEDGGDTSKRRRSEGKRPDADDLDDDFVDEEDLLGPGLTREALETIKLPDDESGQDEGEDEDEDDEGDEDDEVESDASVMKDLDNEMSVVEEADGEAEEPIARKGKRKAFPSPQVNRVKEIPYTFRCPSNIEEFEEILEDLEGSASPTVVQRIRAMHHPSLAQGNKEKLQVCSC